MWETRGTNYIWILVVVALWVWRDYIRPVIKLVVTLFEWQYKIYALTCKVDIPIQILDHLYMKLDTLIPLDTVIPFRITTELDSFSHLVSLYSYVNLIICKVQNSRYLFLSTKIHMHQRALFWWWFYNTNLNVVFISSTYDSYQRPWIFYCPFYDGISYQKLFVVDFIHRYHVVKASK